MVTHPESILNQRCMLKHAVFADTVHVRGRFQFFFFFSVNLIIADKNNLHKINMPHALRRHICYNETDFL